MKEKVYVTAQCMFCQFVNYIKKGKKIYICENCGKVNFSILNF